MARLLADAEHSIAAHWERCLDTGVAGATKEATDRVDARIHAYFEALKALPAAPEDEAIIAAISALYDDLMRIDAETGGGFLEEAERDLLDPLIVNAAEAAGLDTHKFRRRQPTGRPLDFSATRGR
ncbi:MAG: hypothetical protein CTY15_09670 [Methylocystis sp.]|nr:MAG: hypothetical protein CTY15_09670 [Methylocystis sp.]